MPIHIKNHPGITLILTKYDVSRALVYAQWLSAHYSGWFMLYSQGFIQTIQDRDPFFDRETLGAIGVSCDRYASK